MTDRTETCTDCHQPIWWTVTNTGKPLTVNATPDKAGTISVHRRNTPAGTHLESVILTKSRAAAARGNGQQLRSPHRDTCQARR